MAVRVVFTGESFAAQLKRANSQSLSRIAVGTTGGARKAADVILARGRQDISSAGNYGTRWTAGLSATVEPRTGTLINAKITVAHKISYFNIFEDGGVIMGNPLLWIPLSFTGVKVPPRAFPGGLFSVHRTGKAPLLFSRLSRTPIYFGTPRVIIPKKFHIRDIIRTTMAEFQRYYNEAFRTHKV